MTNACISSSLGCNGCQPLTGLNCVTKSTLNENTLLRPKVITSASWNLWDGTRCQQKYLVKVKVKKANVKFFFVDTAHFIL